MAGYPVIARHKRSNIVCRLEKFDIPDDLDEFKHDPLPCVVTNPSHVVRIWTRKSVFPYYVITDQADSFVVELSKRINGE